MEYLIIGIISCLTALLTFFSGFGLGTILMPVFAIFFPLEIAITLTAIVHFLNNLFKINLIWKNINTKILFFFAFPAAVTALLGAITLKYLSSDIIIYSYHIGCVEKRISLLKLIISILLIFFAYVEISNKLKRFSFAKKYIPFGGALSGFFGGLSGHQGALRSLFLLRADLSKDSFIATSIASAVLIDISRLTIYGASFFTKHFVSVNDNKVLYFIAIACSSAFIGSYFGKKILKKITMVFIQKIVGVMIITLAILMASGLI